MRLLTTAADINAEMLRLIESCSSCEIAVAWASTGFKAFDLLTANSAKIERMVVGTHFYQTHPEFIEAFMQNSSVRFVLNSDGVFHPKVYLFEMSSRAWECIIGSPNFTHNGISLNDEMAVLVMNGDQGASEALGGVKAAIDGYWRQAGPISQDQLKAYRETWKRKQPALKNLQGKFGDPQKDNADDKGKTPLAVPILAMSWGDYFQKVKTEKQTAYGHSMAGRLKVIQAVRQLFSTHSHFSDIEPSGRQRIAGLVQPTAQDSIDYRWFGSMKGAGKFWQAINNNEENLSLALDLIPASGAVSRDMYLSYIDRYKLAFPEGRDGIGTASRLLAMKRPDTFVCFDARNKEGLCGAFGISRNIGYEEYWDSIIERIMEANWWCSPPPPSGVERDVWEARAAFLDSLYYDGAELAG